MTSTFWPMSHTAVPCTFPEQLIKAYKSFERFYLSRHSGRRLTWQPSLGNADVRVQFKSRKHDLNVSTFALVILLLFEDILDDQFLTYEASSLHLNSKSSLPLTILCRRSSRPRQFRMWTSSDNYSRSHAPSTRS